MPFFVTRYDFRAPGATSDHRQELFARAVQQAAYADEHGFDAISLSEHHGSADGYLPSPLVAASAMVAATRRIPISIAALLVNFYDPVRLAEDVAVLDHLSAGRVSYTFGLGYRPEEYAMFGRDWHTRGRDVEAAIELLLRAWRGEEIERHGIPTLVRPTPYSRPHPVLFYGGGSPAAARRAARLGLGFQPQHNDPALRATYEEACREQGQEPGMVVSPPPGPATVFCAEDPDGFWERYGDHLLADARGYRSWRADDTDPARHHVADTSTTVAGMRSAGVYAVLHPDDLVERLRDRSIRVVTAHPMCGGLPAEPSWASLRLLGERVLPAVRHG